MNRVLTKTALAGSGAILLFIGGALMFAPQAFLKMSHVIVERDPGLMSELTAPSGVLVITGVLMMLGAVNQRFANSALVSGAIVYGSYGFGRLVSMALHGVPTQSLVTAAVIEIAIATVLTVLLMRGASIERPGLVRVNRNEVML